MSTLPQPHLAAALLIIRQDDERMSASSSAAVHADTRVHARNSPRILGGPPSVQKAIQHTLFCCLLVPTMSFLSSDGRAGGSRGEDSAAPKAPGATPAAAAPPNNSLCAADQLRDMAFDGELIADPVVASDMSSRTSAMRLSFG